MVANVCVLPVFASEPSPEATIPPALDGVSLENRIGNQIDLERTLVDHVGQRIALKTLVTGDKPVLLILAYYRCHVLCSRLLEGLLEGVRQLERAYGWVPGRQFQILTISIDHKETSANAKRKRDDLLLGTTEWPFLVGDEDTIRTLADQVGFKFEYDRATDQYAHPLVTYVLSPAGKVARVLQGVDFSASDLRLALLEASQGKTGSFVEKLLMTCYRYDPSKRRYGVYVLGFMRIGSGLILLVTAAWLAGMLLRDRHRRRRAVDE